MINIKGQCLIVVKSEKVTLWRRKKLRHFGEEQGKESGLEGYIRSWRNGEMIQL